MEFDEQLMSAARLSIIASLIDGAALSFTELKQQTGLADGNLHVQSRKLSNNGYIEILKDTRGSRPVTRFRLTELGREALRLQGQW